MNKNEEVRLRRKQDQRQSYERFGQIYLDLVSILWEHDPIGLNCSSHNDEYAPEACTIIPRLKEAASESELCKIVHQEFIKWFGTTAGSETKYIKIAHELWVVHQSLKLTDG